MALILSVVNSNRRYKGAATEKLYSVIKCLYTDKSGYKRLLSGNENEPAKPWTRITELFEGCFWGRVFLGYNYPFGCFIFGKGGFKAGGFVFFISLYLAYLEVITNMADRQNIL